MSSFDALRQLRVLVVHPRDPDGERLKHCLRRIGCPVESTWPPPADVPSDIDVLFFLVDDRTRRSLPWVGKRPSAAIVAVVKHEAQDILDLLSDATPHAVLSDPVDPFAVLTSLSLARSIFRYEGRLHTKIRKLEETLKSVRKVEQAKTILMRAKNIEEQEAYEYLRRRAMDKGLPIGKVASAVIDASDVFT